MARWNATLLLLLVACLALAACSSAPQPPLDLSRFQEVLTETTTWTDTGIVNSPYFTVAGRHLIIEDEDLIVYEYPQEADAGAAGRRIRDGLLQSAQWVAPPRFYQRGRLLAVFVGQRPSTLAALEALLGPPLSK